MAPVCVLECCIKRLLHPQDSIEFRTLRTDTNGWCMQPSLFRPILNSTLRRTTARRFTKCTSTSNSSQRPLTSLLSSLSHLPLKHQISLHLHQARSLNTGPLQNLFDSSTISGIQIRNVSEAGGIELEDGLTLRSACILLGGRVFLWRTPGELNKEEGKETGGEKGDGLWSGWTKEDFEIFDVVVPKPELLLLGTGKTMSLPPPAIREYLREIGIQVDVMDTKNACSTFNLLSEEGRRVAAALLPLGPITPWK